MNDIDIFCMRSMTSRGRNAVSFSSSYAALRSSSTSSTWISEGWTAVLCEYRKMVMNSWRNTRTSTAMSGLGGVLDTVGIGGNVREQQGVTLLVDIRCTRQIVPFINARAKRSLGVVAIDAEDIERGGLSWRFISSRANWQ